MEKVKCTCMSPPNYRSIWRSDLFYVNRSVVLWTYKYDDVIYVIWTDQ